MRRRLIYGKNPTFSEADVAQILDECETQARVDAAVARLIACGALVPEQKMPPPRFRPEPRKPRRIYTFRYQLSSGLAGSWTGQNAGCRFLEEAMQEADLRIDCDGEAWSEFLH